MKDFRYHLSIRDCRAIKSADVGLLGGAVLLEGQLGVVR